MEKIIMDALTQSGPLVAMLAAAIWWFNKRETKRDERDTRRYDELAMRVKENEEFIRGRMAEVIEENTTASRELADIIRHQPCRMELVAGK